MSMVDQQYRQYTCFMWCGESNCQCNLPWEPLSILDAKSSIPEAFAEKDLDALREEYILSGQFDDRYWIETLVHLIKHEPNDVLRGLARAQVEGNAVKIIETLLGELKKHDEKI
jgi:hypothetical protein